MHVSAVVERPRLAHRQPDRHRLPKHLCDLSPGGRVDGVHHQPICIEAIEVERPIADDELAALRLHHPPVLVDHLATQ